MRHGWSIAVAVAIAGAPRPAAAERYALSMFHYNVQYVAGGLVGFPGWQGEMRPEEVEDRIVTESLHPVLELYAAHPTWGVDIELQGYLLDVLAARHPDTLALLRDLALSGQAEVGSFHYSDLLFIAYRAVAGLRGLPPTAARRPAPPPPLGAGVFAQEGRSAAAMPSHMRALGYTTMVWPKNLWIEQHGDFLPAPLYGFGDVSLVVGALG